MWEMNAPLPKNPNLPMHAHLWPLNKPSFPSSHLNSNRADMLRLPSESKLTLFEILLLRSLQESYVPLYFSQSLREAKKQTRLQRYLNSSISGNNLTPTGVGNLLFSFSQEPRFHTKLRAAAEQDGLLNWMKPTGTHYLLTEPAKAHQAGQHLLSHHD